MFTYSFSVQRKRPSSPLKELNRLDMMSPSPATAGERGFMMLPVLYFLPIVLGVLPVQAVELEQKVTARQEIIRETENFLFNSKVLEAVRKMDQLEPDEDVLQTNKAILLVPIIDILEDIQTVSKQISAGELQKAFDSLSSPKFETKLFKKTFNRYSDNIFISDPKRTNIYLAGGAMPTSLQTQQYLLRNQALTSLDNVRDDVRLMLEDIKKGSSTNRPSTNDQDVIDAIDDCREALEAMQSYLLLADPEDVKLATKVVISSRR